MMVPFLEESKGGVNVEAGLGEISVDILYELSTSYSSSLPHPCTPTS